MLKKVRQSIQKLTHFCSKIPVKIFDTDFRTADFFMLGSVQGLVLITSVVPRSLVAARAGDGDPAGVALLLTRRRYRTA